MCKKYAKAMIVTHSKSNFRIQLCNTLKLFHFEQADVRLSLGVLLLTVHYTRTLLKCKFVTGKHKRSRLFQIRLLHKREYTSTQYLSNKLMFIVHFMFRLSFTTIRKSKNCRNDLCRHMENARSFQFAYALRNLCIFSCSIQCSQVPKKIRRIICYA